MPGKLQNLKVDIFSFLDFKTNFNHIPFVLTAVTIFILYHGGEISITLPRVWEFPPRQSRCKRKKQKRQKKNQMNRKPYPIQNLVLADIFYPEQ